MSPRTLFVLTLVSVGLLGLALWEILGARATQPVVGTTQRGKEESVPNDEPLPDASARSEPHIMVRKIRRPHARAVPDGAGTTTEADVEPRPRGTEEGNVAEAPMLVEAREGFDFVMEELARVGKRRRRISQDQWEQHYRAANDAFAALSAQLRTEDELIELEDAHRLLKERLGRLRVRGKKHMAP